MSEAKLNVQLLRATPNPEEAIAQAAKLCYSSDSIECLWLDCNLLDQTNFIEKLKNMNHLSPFEHVSFTFGIEGISRACSHQLVRHRIASYSQKSQRYVDEANFDYIIPESIINNKLSIYNLEDDALEIYLKTMNNIQEAYSLLVRRGIPKEDARFLLPNATETKIVVTMNARELFHFFKIRCCNNAQWEIRNMATEMLRLVKHVSPNIFKNAGPGCVSGTCPERERCCGKMNEVTKFYEKL